MLAGFRNGTPTSTTRYSCLKMYLHIIDCLFIFIEAYHEKWAVQRTLHYTRLLCRRETHPPTINKRVSRANEVERPFIRITVTSGMEHHACILYPGRDAPATYTVEWRTGSVVSPIQQVTWWLPLVRGHPHAGFLFSDRTIEPWSLPPPISVHLIIAFSLSRRVPIHEPQHLWRDAQEMRPDTRASRPRGPGVPKRLGCEKPRKPTMSNNTGPSPYSSEYLSSLLYCNWSHLAFSRTWLSKGDKSSLLPSFE